MQRLPRFQRTAIITATRPTEHQECLNKAQAVVRAIEKARGL